MSTSIGLLGENFTLVAADDRAEYDTPINGVRWHDGVKKVFQTPWGFVAASGGILGIKERFEQYLNQYKVKNRNNIWLLYCYATKDCEDHLKKYGVENKHIPTSRFIYSFVQKDMKLGIETLDFMFHTRRLKAKNTLIVNAPKDTKRIRRLKDKYFEQAKIVKDIHEAVYLMACLIDEMAKLTKLISNNVNCGIIFKIDENEVVFLEVSENAKTIKKLYKQKQDLSEIMMVRGVKKSDEKLT